MTSIVKNYEAKYCMCTRRTSAQRQNNISIQDMLSTVARDYANMNTTISYYCVN